jgi:hypothetical protein
MEIAVIVLVNLVAIVSVVGVLWALVWAARKDGEEDRAVQRRVGGRRRRRH